MKVWKISMEDKSGYIVTKKDLLILLDEIKNMEDNEINEINIECKEMTKEEYNELSEFNGW